MSNQTRLELAIAGHEHVPPDWMSATRVRPFIFEDPAVVWLEYHGEKHGFLPDTSPYEFLDFIGEKGRQFEGRWVKEMAPNAIRVCAEAYDVRLADKVRETFGYIEKGIPVIAQPALWWAPERIYGVPDLLVHTSWIKERFPGLLSAAGREEGGGRPEVVGESDHYVVFDVKFTTKLDETKKDLPWSFRGVQPCPNLDTDFWPPELREQTSLF